MSVESAAGPSCSSAHVSSHPSRQRQSHHDIVTTVMNSDDNDGNLCALCKSNEASPLASITVF